jgi:hypothetical protein
MTDQNIRYREILARQLAMNQESWVALQRHGLMSETEVRLDFAYRAPNEQAAEGLRKLLADQTDYQIAVRSEGGVFGKRWNLLGTTQPTTISPAILDQWVDWMVTAGLEHECEFDGWGTEV